MCVNLKFEIMPNKKSTQKGHTLKEKGNMRKSQKEIDKIDPYEGNDR